MANTGLPPYFPPDFREPYPTYVRLRNENALRARYPTWSESEISSEAAEVTRRELLDEYAKLTLDTVAYQFDRLLRFTRGAFPDLAVYPGNKIDHEQLEKRWRESAGNLELPFDDHSYIVAATALGLAVPTEGSPRDQAEQILPRLIGWCKRTKPPSSGPTKPQNQAAELWQEFRRLYQAGDPSTEKPIGSKYTARSMEHAVAWAKQHRPHKLPKGIKNGHDLKLLIEARRSGEKRRQRSSS